MINKIFSSIPSPSTVLLKTYFALLLLFMLWRAIFLFFFIDDLSSSHILLYLQSFFVGMRLDLVVISYLLLPVLFTIYLPMVGWSNAYYQSILKVYTLLLFIFASVFCSVNLEWFNEFGHHVNTMIIMYGAGGTEGWELVWEEYNLPLYIFIWLVITWSSFTLWKKQLPTTSSHAVLNGGIAFFITLVVSVLCMRGGTQEKPVDWGYAHFSNDNMANQIAQNPIFFFGRSYIEMQEEEAFNTHFNMDVEFSHIQQQMDKLKHENSIPSSTYQLHMDKKPNIVVIILESFVSENCNFLNPHLEENITPFLSQLSTESINFNRCFANGNRSAFGIGSILCSWPVLPGKPIITQVEASFDNNPATRALELFSQWGYDLTFLYGGDANFDNMKGFAMANGFHHVIDWNDGFLANKSDGTMWGKYDHIMFDKLIDIANSKGEEPFMINFFTTTNHDPFHVPESYENKIPQLQLGKAKHIRAKRTMAYNDIVLKEFFEQAKQTDWYENTIFVITADHGLNVHRNIPNHPLNGHIPFMIHSPLIKIPHQSHKIVSQIDILPTLIDLMDEDHVLPQLYGYSALQGGDGFACRVSHKNLQWITPNYIYYQLMGNEKQQLYTYESLWSQPYTELPLHHELYNYHQRLSQYYIQHAYSTFKRMY